MLWLNVILDAECFLKAHMLKDLVLRVTPCGVVETVGSRIYWEVLRPLKACHQKVVLTRG